MQKGEYSGMINWEELSRKIDEFNEENLVMSLDGGINPYNINGKRYKTDKPPYGRKVCYLGRNGRDSDKRYANRFMNQGHILTVKEIYVGRSSSEVEFVEIPDKTFNTVMFADVEEV